MLEKAELTLINMLSKTKKVFTTPLPVLCSVASYKLFYSTMWSVGTLSLLFVPPIESGGMEINMKDNKIIYNIGQILTVKEDVTLEGLGTQKIVKKGSKIYIGADNLAHHRDGTIQPLGENTEVKGYSVSGLADFIWLYILINRCVISDI